MARDHFRISHTNPNELAGHGGCLCSESKLVDARGPFIVFDAVETDNAFSPYAVLCADCACSAAEKSGALEPRFEAEVAGRLAAAELNAAAAAEADARSAEAAAAAEAVARVRAAAKKAAK